MEVIVMTTNNNTNNNTNKPTVIKQRTQSNEFSTKQLITIMVIVDLVVMVIFGVI